jgi:hypothetical protein
MLPSEMTTSLLSGTVGAYEFGVMVALFMYGIAIVQAYSVLRCEASLKSLRRIVLLNCWVQEFPQGLEKVEVLCG